MANEELEKLSTNLKQMQDKFTNDWKEDIVKEIDMQATKHQEVLESGKGLFCSGLILLPKIKEIYD